MRCANLDGLSCKPTTLDNALSLNPVKGHINEKIYLVDQYASQPVLVLSQIWQWTDVKLAPTISTVRKWDCWKEGARLRECRIVRRKKKAPKCRDCDSWARCSLGALWRAAFRRLFALRFSTPLKHCWWFASSAGRIDFWGCSGNIVLMYVHI